MVGVRTIVLAVLSCCHALVGCGTDVGPCDPEAADQLVYGRNGLVATKGQALAHDSCGNGAFCHAASADGRERFGAPAGMTFDMLPTPAGVGHVLENVEGLWSEVSAGDMPPAGDAARAQGDGDWAFDIARQSDSTRLPSIRTNEGKGIFRNWLACGAPVVTETQVPVWALPPNDPFAGDETPTWHDIYETILQPQCAQSSCHVSSRGAGGLSMPDECGTYAALRSSGACGEVYVRPNDAAGSLLIDKLTNETPRCGDRMPRIGPLPESFTTAIAEWIEAGAEADTCP